MEKFLCRAPGSTYYKANGDAVIFAGGIYETSDPTEIQELKVAIATGCTLLYQEAEVVVESEKVVKMPAKQVDPSDMKV